MTTHMKEDESKKIRWDKENGIGLEKMPATPARTKPRKWNIAVHCQGKRRKMPQAALLLLLLLLLTIIIIIIQILSNCPSSSFSSPFPVKFFDLLTFLLPSSSPSPLSFRFLTIVLFLLFFLLFVVIILLFLLFFLFPSPSLIPPPITHYISPPPPLRHHYKFFLLTLLLRLFLLLHLLDLPFGLQSVTQSGRRGKQEWPEGYSTVTTQPKTWLQDDRGEKFYPELVDCGPQGRKRQGLEY